MRSYGIKSLQKLKFQTHISSGVAVIDVECLVKWIIIIFIIYVIHLRFSIHSQTSVTTQNPSGMSQNVGLTRFVNEFMKL